MDTMPIRFSPMPPGIEMNNGQIKHMVDRFLGWRLPEGFNPDAGISFKREFNEHTAHPMKHEPVGTNLLDATQAEAMLRYVVEGLPAGEAANPTTLQSSINAHLDKLTAAMRAKGYPSACCHLEFHSDGQIRVWLRSADYSTKQEPLAFRRWSGLDHFQVIYADSIEKALTEAAAEIAEMVEEPTSAMAPWFDVAQSAQAAE
jgi:hypothetical protein